MSAAYASRFEAVFLCKHHKGPKMSLAAAAKYMGKSKALIRKWIQRYKQTKTIDDLPNRGTKRNFTKPDEKQILNVFLKNLGLTLRQGQAKLKTKGLEISLDSVQRHLRAHDVK